MSAPVVSLKKLEPKNGTLINGVWVFEIGTPVIVNYAVDSSGDGQKYIKQVINWGDETVVESSQLPVGRPFQSHHAYTEVGEYTIKLGAVNLSGAECLYNSNNLIRVRVTPLAESKKELFKWRGLALPFKSISDNIAAIEDLPVSITFALAQDAPELAEDNTPNTVIVVAGEALEFELGASVVISQEDKLITTSKVVGINLNVITLDESFPLVDSYERDKATVELIRSNLGRTFHKERVNKSWYFPVSYDNDLVKASIANILSTTPYERVMLPEFGSRLHEIPFEPNDKFTNGLIQRYVVTAIEKWEPRADVVDVKIVNLNDTVTAHIKLKINLETFTVDFNLDQSLTA